MYFKRLLPLALAIFLLPALAMAQEGTRQTFFVAKLALDGNPNEVEVNLSCNTGLPLDQSKDIEPVNTSFEDYVEFVVVDFDSGEMNCEVTETPRPDYGTFYVFGWDSELPDALNAPSLDGPGIDISENGCSFESIPDEAVEDALLWCIVVNYPLPVTVTVNKEWIIENSGGDSVDQYFDLTLYCDSGAIIDGENFCAEEPVFDVPDLAVLYACKRFSGNGSDSFEAEVFPSYPSTSCWVEETVYDSAVEVDNGCGSIVISAGNGAECTVTNTVFFEGIPTLSQYGMAILALLMLGVGLVGFRRMA